MISKQLLRSLIALNDKKETKRKIPPPVLKRVKQWAEEQTQILTKKQADDLLFFVANKMAGIQLGGGVRSEKQLASLSETQLSEQMITRAFSRFIEAFDITDIKVK